MRFLSVEPLLEDLGDFDLTGIHWVIVGGESGARPRPMREEWVVSIRDRCALAGVPFFFKQWGGTQKKKAGRLLDGRTYDQMPPRPVRPVAAAAERRAWLAEFVQRPDLLQLGLRREVTVGAQPQRRPSQGDAVSGAHSPRGRPEHQGD